MLAAIIATIVTIVVLVIALVVAFTVRNRTKSPKASSKRMDVRSIGTVGVGGRQGGRGRADARVNAPQTSATNLGETLKSRFIAMGVLAAGIFGSLAVKAWDLQVVNAGQYRQEADENQYKTVSTPAPRGYIYDADGIELVRNRKSLTVLADVEVADDRTVVQRLRFWAFPITSCATASKMPRPARRANAWSQAMSIFAASPIYPSIWRLFPA